MKASLSHCGQEVYAHDRDHFWQCLFIPGHHREAFFCLYALNLELARIPSMVSEEMIGHIRYAWWQESIEAIYAGNAVKGQPVLQALAAAKLPQEVALPLVILYRERFPEKPESLEDTLEKLSLQLLQALCPEAEQGWRKAHSVMARHRNRHGKRCNSWLIVKLLILSI